ncbi:hypothetical protein GK047_08120 [Paenibacillus sp. SYP-B3998]|uniref:Uncharacterized protein n=1 Tax=Paenibacillus sp. SYP-B3998 TaxID=2678564 RepID=A0A6G3ZV03_9BACL|nr:hypothetical protein [Paenibacillus sp. SYP-B3998]NEW05972.1 hypothetical protein [Paenibacillus sp. SYP-B3998]
MARGGKREGSGRKSIGRSKTVSLTLTEEEWFEIEQSHSSISAYIRELIKDNKIYKKKRITKGE